MLRLAVIICVAAALIDAKDCQARRELQRQAANQSMPGYYEVQCKDDDPDEYVMMQCWASTGRCWCVDQYGVTIPNSHVNPGQEIDCSTFGWCTSFEMGLLEQAMDSRPPLDGEEETPMLPPGAPTPTCDDNGHFAKQQSWGSTGQTWCAVSNGNKIPGTITGPIQEPYDCENLPVCLAKAGSLAHLEIEGIYPFGLDLPECDENGMFRRTQCNPSNGYCWCVDSETGEEIEGSARGPTESQNLDCDNLTGTAEEVEPDTACRMLDAKQKEHLLGSENPIIGFWRVKCEKDGSFKSSQCHPSTGQCWCVDENGMEERGTRTSPGTPPYPCKSLRVSSCDSEKNMVESQHSDMMMVGMFVPQCEDDGKYKAKQCWGSTGQCWCVTPAGQEVTFTRRGPGDSPNDLDCSTSSQPETSRVLLRDEGVGSEEDQAGDAQKVGMSTMLIAVIAVLSCLLLVALVGGFILYKKNGATPQNVRYTEVDADI